MKLAELVILGEGYDTSEKNREHYDDFTEWKSALRSAGGDYYMPKKDVSFYVGNAHDGKCGEFDTEKGEGWLCEKWSKPVKESVGVVLSPEAKKSKKFNEKRVKAYGDHIKTSAANTSYGKKHGINSDLSRSLMFTRKNVKEELNEGMWVVKSSDGVEKRFKDVDSAEAKAWKSSSQKKSSNVKLAVYSDPYWEKKEDESSDSDFVSPWKKIGDAESDQIERLVKDQHGAGKTDWTLGKASETTRDGTTCATRVVRIMFEYGPGDDMGVDEPTSDTQSILVARNPKKPKQLDFVKYV